MASEFSGRTVVVTGGGSGLGRAIALGFAAEGAEVIVAGRRIDRLEAVRAEAPGGRMRCVAADVTRQEDLERLAASAEDGIDVLVHCAGILTAGSLESTTLQAWDRMMDINLRSVFALTKLAVPGLQRRRGNVIAMSSVAGPRPYAGLLAYCVSKAALDQLTRCLALELAPMGVRVNAINPGVVVTDLHRTGGMSEESYAAFLERGKVTHPMGRVGQPADVAAMALFLASEKAAWITGGTFSVDGGRALLSAR